LDSQGVLHVSNRIFSDLVASDNDRITGANEPTLDIDIDTRTGEASLSGNFMLVPASNAGAWRGELQGSIRDGLVTAFGMANGTGAFDGSILSIDFRQVREPNGHPPHAEPKAFFDMEGWILDR
jgi:hypothetical protein